jgi:hypothetical protein
MKTEPSRFAVEAATLLGRCLDRHPEHLKPAIQHAIDQACAEKDKRIAELEGLAETVTRGSFGATQAMAAENAHLRGRIAEMELKLGDADRINGELCVLIIGKELRMAEMAAILQYMPHAPDEQQAGDARPGQEPCAANCPRCAWDRMRGGG